MLTMVLAALALGADPQAAPTACPLPDAAYSRASELPAGARSALGFDMADVGEPFRATDVITPETRSLPTRRFGSATLESCQLTVRYEFGGRGHGWSSVTLLYSDGRWSVLR